MTHSRERIAADRVLHQSAPGVGFSKPRHVSASRPLIPLLGIFAAIGVSIGAISIAVVQTQTCWHDGMGPKPLHPVRPRPEAPPHLPPAATSIVELRWPSEAAR